MRNDISYSGSGISGSGSSGSDSNNNILRKIATSDKASRLVRKLMSVSGKCGVCVIVSEFVCVVEDPMITRENIGKILPLIDGENLKL